MSQTTRTTVLVGLLCVVFIGAGAYLAFANGNNPLIPAVSQDISTTTYTVVPVATSTPAPVIHKPEPTPAPAPVPPTSGTVMITPADNGKTITLTQGERFGVAMGDSLNWNLVFEPTGIVTRVTNIATTVGEQGVYTATAPGTTVLHATGAPICKSEMCAQFLQEVTVTIVVK